MAASVTQLAWGAITFGGGYDAAGQTDNMVDSLKWATDYFIAAHTGPMTLVGQVWTWIT
jgi:endoglucanase